jgi:hypothetical protein
MQDGKEKVPVQGSPNGKAHLQAVNETEHMMLDETEFIMDFFAEGAKVYLRLWGPLGAPMVYAVEEWATMQRAYFRSLHQVIGPDGIGPDGQKPRPAVLHST